MSKIYHQGETIRQKAHVTDVSGTLINPDTIVITIIDSESTKKVDAQAMTNDVTGKYYYDHLIPTDAALGTWTTEIKAVKGFTAIEQDQFTVVEAIA